jgi:hypothetical protein
VEFDASSVVRGNGKFEGLPKLLRSSLLFKLHTIAYDEGILAPVIEDGVGLPGALSH